MKKVLLMMVLVSGTLFGQTDPATSKATVSVNGSSKVYVMPDMTELNIHVSSVKMNMADATKAVGEQTAQYTKILKQLGFLETDVKTTNFSAYKNRIYRDYRTIDSGYVVSQQVTVKFAYNQTTLQKIIARFSDTKDPVDFAIGFYVSDALREKTEAELQSKAVADARKKASNLASAAGVKMTAIKAISYGTGDALAPAFYNRKEMMFANGEAYDGGNLNLSPQEVELQEMVTVVWFIE